MVPSIRRPANFREHGPTSFAGGNSRPSCVPNSKVASLMRFCQKVLPLVFAAFVVVAEVAVVVVVVVVVLIVMVAEVVVVAVVVAEVEVVVDSSLSSATLERSESRGTVTLEGRRNVVGVIVRERPRAQAFRFAVLS